MKKTRIDRIADVLGLVGRALVVGGMLCGSILIWNLIIKHSCIYPSQELTKIDMHIKLDEAKDLCEALKEILKIQAKGKGGDKSLHEAETSTS